MGKEMEEDFQRSFGKLESKVDALNAVTMQLLSELKSQETSSVNDRRRLHIRINKIVRVHLINSQKLTELTDRVEGHGKALVDLETFQDRVEAQEVKEKATITTNRKWIKGLIAAVGILGGAEADHALGGKIAKSIGSFFGFR